MTTPKRDAIIQRATEIWFEDQFKAGIMNPTNPETYELKESGAWTQAISELMMDRAKHETEQWSNYDRETEKLGETDNITKTEIPFSVSDALASGFYCCGTRQLSGKTNLVKHLVKRLINEGITVFVVDPSLAWLNNSPISKVMAIPKGCGELTVKHENTIFDVSRLGYGERFAFVKNFCAGLTVSHIDSYPYPEMLIFEEAQTYLPNGCMRSKKYSDITDFVTVGGNYGLSFGAVTQFSASVDKAIVKLAQQRYFGLTTEDNDKKYVRSFVGKDWLNEVVRLQRGQFLYQNRAEIAKFQCQKFGSVTVSNCYNFNYNFPLSMVG